MVRLADIKRDLPTWPDEVIEDWLLPLANRPDTGWPPPEPLGNHPWKYILGGRPLSWWKEVTWSLEEDGIQYKILASGTKQIVDDMINGHVNAVQNTYGRWPESKDRFLSAGRVPIGEWDLSQATCYYPPCRWAKRSRRQSSRHCALLSATCRRERGVKRDGVPLAAKQKIWVGRHVRGEVTN